MRAFLNWFDRFESIVCRLLLVVFVCLLFVQIVARALFQYSFSWIEELSVYLFVWFVFFGASYAAKMAAHNRVSFQFKLLPEGAIKWIEGFADLFWIAFNVYFVYLAIDFIFNRMNKFWTAQTLGIQMKWIYLILPIAFTLMTVRILQVNYRRLVRGEAIEDPDKIDMEKLKRDLKLDTPG